MTTMNQLAMFVNWTGIKLL